MNDASDSFRLPVGETLRDIFRFLWTTRRDLVLIGAIPVVLLTLWQVVATRLLGIPDPAHPTAGHPAGLGDVLLTYGPDLILYVMFAVAWHRRYLAAYETATVWSALRWDRRKTRFLGRSLLVGLIAAAIIAVPVTMLTIFVVIVNLAAAAPTPATPLDAGTLGSIVAIAAGLMFLLLYLRLSIWLPPASVDAPFGLLESWRLGRENTWRLFAIAIVSELPVWLVFVAWNVTSALLPHESVTVSLLLELVRYTLSYLSLAAGITALSACYDRLLARIASDPLYNSTMPFMDE